jgi:hypothetical protein
MNGNVVKTFNILGMPAKMLPGGYLLGRVNLFKNNMQESKTILEVDWNGNVIWSFDHWLLGVDGIWYSRQHHDYEREGFPTGYYSPYVNPEPLKGHTLVLAWENISFPRITDKELLDCVIYEVDEKGNLISKEQGGFFWRATDHFDEFGFEDNAIKALKNTAKNYKAYDWFHINTLTLLGENKWYDKGDKRFNPKNIIISSRGANIIAIIDRDTGKIVWKVGPNFKEKPFNKLGQIIGQHHTHMIQKGLPGAGNILLFDNGGGAGYGHLLNQKILPTMANNEFRFYSRILEFDPITYDIKWKYTDTKGFIVPLSGDNHLFFSFYISSAQRLPNGNTLIDEGALGRIFEVTPDKQVVWEYISPYLSSFNKKAQNYNLQYGIGKQVDQQATGPLINVINPVYRAYRIPPKWLKDTNGNMLKGDNGKPLVDYKKINNNCW